MTKSKSKSKKTKPASVVEAEQVNNTKAIPNGIATLEEALKLVPKLKAEGEVYSAKNEGWLHKVIGVAASLAAYGVDEEGERFNPSKEQPLAAALRAHFATEEDYTDDHGTTKTRKVYSPMVRQHAVVAAMAGFLVAEGKASFAFFTTKSKAPPKSGGAPDFGKHNLDDNDKASAYMIRLSTAYSVLRPHVWATDEWAANESEKPVMLNADWIRACWGLFFGGAKVTTPTPKSIADHKGYFVAHREPKGKTKGKGNEKTVVDVDNGLAVFKAFGAASSAVKKAGVTLDDRTISQAIRGVITLLAEKSLKDFGEVTQEAIMDLATNLDGVTAELADKSEDQKIA